jgi:hypothetical protein
VQSLRKCVNEQRGLRSSAEKGRSEVDAQLRQEAAARQSEVSELNERMEMFKVLVVIPPFGPSPRTSYVMVIY